MGLKIKYDVLYLCLPYYRISLDVVTCVRLVFPFFHTNSLPHSTLKQDCTGHKCLKDPSVENRMHIPLGDENSGQTSSKENAMFYLHDCIDLKWICSYQLETYQTI